MRQAPSRSRRGKTIFVVNVVIAAAVLTPHVLVQVLPRDLYNVWNNPNWFSGLLALWWLMAALCVLPATIIGLAVTAVLAISREYRYAAISLILAIASLAVWRGVTTLTPETTELVDKADRQHERDEERYVVLQERFARPQRVVDVQENWILILENNVWVSFRKAGDGKDSRQFRTELVGKDVAVKLPRSPLHAFPHGRYLGDHVCSSDNPRPMGTADHPDCIDARVYFDGQLIGDPFPAWVR